jgi:hypothetical protein
MVSPTLIIFAVEAGVKLGRKFYDVLIDETVERPLMLPVGDLFGGIAPVGAQEFFDRDENRHLVESGGPYHGLSDAELVLAYKSLRAIGERIGDSEEITGDAVEIVQNLHRFEQLKEGFGAGHPAQRILGTLVEIGIDYFAANPSALGKDSGGRKILHAFILRLDEADFAEGTPSKLVGDVLLAALRTLNENVTLVDDDHRLQVLLGGVTKALIEDVSVATSQAEQIRREDLARRIASSILRGGASAFHENIGIFIEDDPSARTLVQSAVGQVLEGIRGKDDLFSNESIELIFDSALTAVAGNSHLFSDEKVVQELIRQTVTALTEPEGRELFTDATVAAVVGEALDVVQRHAETLIDPDEPGEQLLAFAVRATAASLSHTLAGGGEFRALLSKAQLVALSRAIFEEVARDPEPLLGDDLDEARRTALAQIVSSVARALGEDPSRLVTAEGLVELMETALRVTVRNAEKLLDLDSEDPRTNALFRILQQLAQGLVESRDPRRLVTREVFVDIAKGVLPVASANLDPLLGGVDEPIKRTVEIALTLASGALEGRINGDNLPVLIEQLLREASWEELDLGNDAAVAEAATRILRAA